MEWVDHCKQKKIIAIDTETNSLNYIEAELVGISLSIDEGKAIYIPLAHDYENAPLQLDRVETLNILKPLLEDKEIKKIGHHLKFDAHIFARYGITLKGMEYDSMLESYVLNSVASRHGMNSVAQYYLNRETTHFEDVAGKGAKQITFNQVDIKTATAYAAEDADVMAALFAYLYDLGKNQSHSFT